MRVQWEKVYSLVMLFFNMWRNGLQMFSLRKILRKEEMQDHPLQLRLRVVSDSSKFTELENGGPQQLVVFL